MESSGVWIGLELLDPDSESSTRCTWHGDRTNPCRKEPVTGVLDRRGYRWSACAEAAAAVAADRGVPLPPGPA
ncbi:hypothetical protein ABZS61_12630 [Streptomyces sp. NPDC005566]|uniref:hypothetical protein n=1 Tax=Streptomyces sp. NPDC005566 TaxID=3156886 RepID=UPI0033B69E07